MGEREEGSEYVDVADQSDDEDVDGEFNLSAAEEDGYDDEDDGVDDDKEAELTRSLIDWSECKRGKQESFEGPAGRDGAY
ncbi:hypothetical protein EMCG_03268 [[Emmonsia] crescens]|uniref:Uncharacterized protein n=1 Tax=[Emmonsia] crescens TaxID=73230 RepID=A0A0G2J8I6_9EURO|nr:hypothetical protein EMCG_03268 [Emmonsia crescens UAMH 3008]